MYKAGVTIRNVLERKSSYQKHFFLGTLVSGLVCLSLVLLIMPHEEKVVIEKSDIAVHLQELYGGAEKLPGRTGGSGVLSRGVEGTAAGFKAAGDSGGMNFDPDYTYVFDDTFLDVIDKSGSPDGNENDLWWGGVEKQGNPGKAGDWPIEDEFNPLDMIRLSDIDRNPQREPKEWKPDRPIRVNFPDAGGIRIPPEARGKIDVVTIKIMLIVDKHGTIPYKSGIRLLSYAPADLSARYVEIYMESIQNLLRRDALIYPARKNGRNVTDSAEIRIKYLKDPGGFNAISSAKVQFDW